MTTKTTRMCNNAAHKRASLESGIFHLLTLADLGGSKRQTAQYEVVHVNSMEESGGLIKSLHNVLDEARAPSLARTIAWGRKFVRSIAQNSQGVVLCTQRDRRIQ